MAEVYDKFISGHLAKVYSKFISGGQMQPQLGIWKRFIRSLLGVDQTPKLPNQKKNKNNLINSKLLLEIRPRLNYPPTEVGHSIDSGVFQAFRGFVLSMCCC